MQIQYSAVAAGNGSNPKAPPPVSFLLKQYIIAALRVQEAIDEAQDDPTNEVLLYTIRSHVNSMLDIYERMNEYEREIVEEIHISPYKARVISQHINIALNLGNPEDEDLLRSAVNTLSDILYTTKVKTCTLH